MVKARVGRLEGRKEPKRLNLRVPTELALKMQLMTRRCHQVLAHF